MNTTLTASYILIKPSSKMCENIQKLNIKQNIPIRIKALIGKQRVKETNTQIVDKLCSTTKDYIFISSLLNNKSNETLISNLRINKIKTFSPKNSCEGFLDIDDLLWLNKELEIQRTNGHKIYLYELLEDSTIYVPENEKIERNPELENRCKIFKNYQDDLRYKSMTKYIDNIRFRLPEESIGYQIKQMNRQLIAVCQFIISVLAGFAFGFIGIELLFGNIDFGLKLLLGIMCALAIALAELYFLAKQLGE